MSYFQRSNQLLKMLLNEEPIDSLSSDVDKTAYRLLMASINLLTERDIIDEFTNYKTTMISLHYNRNNMWNSSYRFMANGAEAVAGVLHGLNLLHNTEETIRIKAFNILLGTIYQDAYLFGSENVQRCSVYLQSLLEDMDTFKLLNDIGADEVRRRSIEVNRTIVPRTKRII